VQIRDKRLGILHYLFILLIIAYIVGWTIFYEKRYLLLDSPVGSIRTSLQSAQTKGLIPPPPSQLPYCWLPNQTQYHNFPNLNCSYWDENFVVYPIVEQTAMFITTRVDISEQTLFPPGCSLDDNTCTYQPSDDQQSIYIGNIEHFTLLLDHSMYVNGLGLQANSLQLPGSILDSHGKEIHKLPINNSVGHEGAQDILDVSVLIHASGVFSLDNPSGANASRSMRNDGIVLLFFITYSNTYSYSTNNMRYQYTIKRVLNTKFKAVEPVFTKNITTRVLWDRHGIRIIFLQVGRLGVFDFQTLLLTFVSGLGLLAAATFVVDFLAFRIMPSKQLYYKYKYKETPEMHAEGMFADAIEPNTTNSDDDEDESDEKNYLLNNIQTIFY